MKDKSNYSRLKIFISYTMRDLEITLKELEKINEVFSNMGDIYIDYIHNNSINKQDEVIRKLILSDIIIVVYSSEVFSSPWVLFEIQLALGLNKPITIYHNHKFFSLNSLFKI